MCECVCAASIPLEPTLTDLLSNSTLSNSRTENVLALLAELLNLSIQHYAATLLCFSNLFILPFHTLQMLSNSLLQNLFL